MVSPLGLSVKESWQGVLQGRSGVAPIEHFDCSGLPVTISAAVKNFDAKNYMDAKSARKMDVFIQYGLAAAGEAIADSGLEDSYYDKERTGVAIGSGIGGLPLIEHSHNVLLKSGPRKISPFFIPASIINLVSGHVSMKYGFQGPNIAIVTACTTGSHNIGYAARTIAYGDSDVMVAGGTEMASCSMCVAGFASARALSRRNDDPQKASRPWDKQRDGFVLGDGAGVLVLEEYEHAKKRNAPIYAELAGFGMSSDAYHITAPEPEGKGFIASMNNALKDAHLTPADIGYINAHGTSTPTGDVIESNAVKKVFGDHAKQLSMSSTKSMIGHLLGASGSVEAIFTILALRDQIAPPTINLDEPDVGCDLDYVPHQAKEKKIQAALSNSFGFGGTNATLVFQRYHS
jgi:3-oxoacyl-[acyl-carrier-protein] synthase II